MEILARTRDRQFSNKLSGKTGHPVESHPTDATGNCHMTLEHHVLNKGREKRMQILKDFYKRHYFGESCAVSSHPLG